jgi:hypothetical protein
VRSGPLVLRRSEVKKNRPCGINSWIAGAVRHSGGVLGGVVFAGFLRVVLGVQVVAVGRVRVVGGVGVVAGFVMVGGVLMVFSGLLVVLGSLGVMVGRRVVLRHEANSR